jgi:hypothetical protein
MTGRDAAAPDPGVGVNSEVVAADVIDGEAMIINLANGMYYTADGVGAEIWSMVDAGHGPRAMAEHLAARYGVEAEAVLLDVEQFLAALSEADLTRPTVNPAAAAPSMTDGVPDTPYVRPQLVAYSDLGDVLALDPPLPRLDASWEP